MDDNYTKSNKITEIKGLELSLKTKKLYNALRDKTQVTSTMLKNLSDAICRDLGVTVVSNVEFEGRQPYASNGKRLKNKTLGMYNGLGIIRVYKYTAVRKQVVAAKTAISTLLHEINHHLDYRLIGLAESIHSSGFYSRLKQLQTVIGN